ncbi:MAG: hypothetical protein Q4C95_02050 [Planctomycetia bacterium]|nr:hypothetical protein [Planctomycetia bacterium]
MEPHYQSYAAKRKNLSVGIKKVFSLRTVVKIQGLRLLATPIRLLFKKNQSFSTIGSRPFQF